MTRVGRDDLPVEDTDVLVVGAGPTGLMAGLVLARRGTPVVVVDGKEGPTRESRALAVQARSMELYDQLGLVEGVLAGAHLVTHLQVGQASNPVAVDVASAQRGATGYPGIHVFEQSRNEELLSRALHREGSGVRWGHRLVDLVDRTGGVGGRVEALVEGPGGFLLIRARWCVGADGTGSSVRRTLNVPFEGVTDDATFWVADLRGVGGLRDGALALRTGRAGFALLFPLGPGGHARVISLATGDHVDQDSVLAAARTDIGLTVDHVDWFSTYRVHHRVAARFAQGSVFLAGDAAHVHSPVGGQGMNTGLQDAHDLAHLLADVSHAHVDPSALQRYERERRPVAVRLVRTTDRAFGLVARRHRGTAWLRRRAAALAGPVAPRVLATPAGTRIAGLLGQYRIRYPFAPDTTPLPSWAADGVVGLRLPPVAGNSDPLRSLSWQLHSYGTQVARPGVPDWIEGPHAFGPDPAGRLRTGRLYLVRPDGFVAASLPVHRGAVDERTTWEALRAHHITG